MVQTPKGRVYVKFCTKPTSCKFDLKSMTNSQMAKSRAEHLSPPKKSCRLADSQLADLEIWDTYGCGGIDAAPQVHVSLVKKVYPQTSEVMGYPAIPGAPIDSSRRRR